MKFTVISNCLLSAALLTSAAPVAHLQVYNGVPGMSSAVPREISTTVYLDMEKRGGPDEFHNPDVEWLNKFLNGLNGFFDGMSRWFGGQS